MSDQNRSVNEIKNNVVKPEVKPEVKLEVKPEVKQATADNSDIFITESDIFEVIVRYYKKNGMCIVEGVDSDFDILEKSKEFLVVIKYPSQADSSRISMLLPVIGSGGEEVDVRQFLQAEMTRFLTLVRKWNLNKELNNDNILSMNPKIIKGILAKIRETLGMEGLI